MYKERSLEVTSLIFIVVSVVRQDLELQRPRDRPCFPHESDFFSHITKSNLFYQMILVESAGYFFCVHLSDQLFFSKKCGDRN